MTGRAQRGALVSSMLRVLLLLLLPLATGCPSETPDVIPLRLVSSEPVPAPSGEWLREQIFEDSRGSRIRAYLRGPEGPVEPRARYGIILIAGRETGREAAAMVPGPLDGLVLGVEYLEEIPTALEARVLVRQLLTIRRAANRMPGVLLGLADHLATDTTVDPARLALVGVSFGVPFAATAGRDPRFRGVALLYGGADLALLFREHLPIENRFGRRIAARLLAIAFRGVEPARHVEHISPTPLLLINGSEDDFVPRASALRLANAAREPVRHIWLPRGHLMPWPQYFPLMRELADSTVAHFDFL